MRNYPHIIDTRAVRQTINAIPDYCVVRDLNERDYGIDLMIEIFKKTGVDKIGHDTYSATGHVCYLQIKGTNRELHLNRDNTVSFNIEQKALLYVEKFATPFILVRTCTLDGKKKVYYLWLQRYISDELDFKRPAWRTEKQETFAVKIPIKNDLETNFDKVKRIASRIKYVEEHAEFYEKYTLMKPAFEGMIEGKLTKTQYKQFILDLKRIKNLNTLLEFNNCQVDQTDIETLINYVTKIQDGKINPESIEDFPDPLMFNLGLLETDNFMRMAMEGLIAENDNDTVY